MTAINQRHERSSLPKDEHADIPTMQELDEARRLALDEFLSRQPSIIRVEVVNSETTLRKVWRTTVEVSQILGAIASVIVLLLALFGAR